MIIQTPRDSLGDIEEVVNLTRIPCIGEKVWYVKEFLTVVEVSHIDVEIGWSCNGKYAVAQVKATRPKQQAIF